MSARAKKPTTTPPPTPRSKAPTLKGNPPSPGGIYDSGNFNREAATPIKAISMKTPGSDKPAQRDTGPREVPKVKLRALSDVHKSTAPQQSLGFLAPPADPAAARARRMHDYIVYGSLSVIVASGVALVIWFLAR